jgi:hypothetical protein
MPVVRSQNLNRLLHQNVTPAQLPTSFNLIELKADPSQQYLIYGVQYGFIFNAAADNNQLVNSYVLGYINPNTNFAIVPTFPFTEIGEICFIDALTSETDTFRTVDFSNPLVLNGDRIVTFAFYPPVLAAAVVGTTEMCLLVRGEITQVADEDKPRLGNWRLR